MNLSVLKKLWVQIVTATILIACWIYVPWDEVQTNGTADGILIYHKLGYQFIWHPPQPFHSTISKFSKVWVQPDWLNLSISTALAFGIYLFFLQAKKFTK